MDGDRMIKIEHTPDGFKLSFKDYFFMEHSAQEPCFSIGWGEGRYEHRNFIYKIREIALEKTPLLNFNIGSQSERELVLTFDYPNGTLEVLFSVVEDRLEIKPKCSNPDYNRFWF